MQAEGTRLGGPRMLGWTTRRNPPACHPPLAAITLHPLQPTVFQFAPSVQHSGFEGFTAFFKHGTAWWGASG